MAISAYKNVWEHSPSRGNARLVELALAEHVNEEDVKAGRPAECWPSQNTLAKMAGCKRSTVQRALRALIELGRISDTGRRQKRSVVVYRLLMTDFGSGGEDLTILSDDRTSVLGKPFREVSTMSTKTTTKLEKVLAYGDIASAYRIVDRIGLTVEVIQHLFGENRRPTGQRGFYAYFRVGAKVVVPEAVQVLKVKE